MKTNLRVFVVFLALRIVRSLFSGTRNSDSASSDLSSRMRSGSSPCDWIKVNSGTEDAHAACLGECNALQIDISKALDLNKTSKPIKLLHSTCGMVTGGQCSAGVHISVCLCEARTLSNGRLLIPVQLCRHATQLMHWFSKGKTTATGHGAAKSLSRKQTNGHDIGSVADFEEVGMQRYSSSNHRKTPGFRPRTSFPRPQTVSPGQRPGRPPSAPDFRPSGSAAIPRSPSSLSAYSRPFVPAAQPAVPPATTLPRRPTQAEEDFNTEPDNQQEGKILVTDVRISGKNVRAIVDTGADCTLIHPDYANGVSEDKNKLVITTSNRQDHEIKGRTTIDVEVRKGITVSVTGFVTHLSPKLLLGNDFFFTYAAKIWISEELMEISVGGRKYTMIVKLRSGAARMLMMNVNPNIYTAMGIDIHLNGHSTRMIVDTGSAVTVVSKLFVGTQPKRRINCRVAVGDVSVSFNKETDVTIQIKDFEIIYPALITDNIPLSSLVTGNAFNKRYIELIDFGTRSVIVRGINRFYAQIIIFKGS